MHKASFNSRLFKHLIAWQQHFNNSRLGPVLACTTYGNSFWNPSMEQWIPFLQARAHAEIERRDTALWIQDTFPLLGAWERYMFYVAKRYSSPLSRGLRWINFSTHIFFLKWLHWVVLKKAVFQQWSFSSGISWRALSLHQWQGRMGTMSGDTLNRTPEY